ncbi:phosphopantetheine-binding protein [Bradyrhizobium genosp. A]|uniref:phosphopantetheine-binding protein n=1 Tax=Bradyrhizobium genosp. A TaxID=83626 RepID=UPI003CF4B8A5
MSRDEIMIAVKQKVVAIIPNLELGSLDPSKPLEEYGGTSLDLVEIISELMRELRAKVPRSEITDINTIDDIVDLLHKTLAHQQS